MAPHPAHPAQLWAQALCRTTRTTAAPGSGTAVTVPICVIALPPRK